MLNLTSEQQTLLEQYNLMVSEQVVNSVVETQLIHAIEGSIEMVLDMGGVDRSSSIDDIYKQIVNKQNFRFMLEDILNDFKHKVLKKFDQMDLENVVELKSVKYDKNRMIDDVEFEVNSVK